MSENTFGYHNLGANISFKIFTFILKFWDCRYATLLERFGVSSFPTV